jgi:hypothetical protein
MDDTIHPLIAPLNFPLPPTDYFLNKTLKIRFFFGVKSLTLLV